ncbi:MFS transporter [Promicromonospora thailandica]|uniref:Sugar phosphate permease n=1 Tax=Promicromonospora thailandica TaxID=765201 RepID=A0A9X2G6K0_9MICO|nr:MFS transporter [Promicromonospora thailandica]MCP2266570.1 Sugar phosphate permease [Promicromonospora thailandica]BFF17356.1 MFS transporter [Promicromonospora thailandica]
MNQPQATARDALHAVASRKAVVRLLPLLCLAYFMAFVDRTNVGLAKSSLETDVGIGAAAYGLGAGIFFLSYALLEVPSNLIMHRVGPRAWITRIALTWGALTTAMMFVQGEASFYVVRFLLGAAEAGLFPALMYIITVWFAQSQRATMVGLLYLAVCAGLTLGGPLGGALMELAGTSGLHGWQWMFLIEGGFTILVGFAVWRWLPDKPSDARWLTPDEAAVLEERAATQGAPAHTTLRGNVRVAFGRPFILALALVYLANQVASVAIQYNFPSIVESIDISRPFLVGLVSGSVGIGALLGVLVIPAVQRRVRDEVRVIIGCSIGTAVTSVAYVLASAPVLRISLIVLAMFFLIGVLPIYWSVATARMSGLMAAAGLAFINTIGLLGGFLGPYLYGWAEGTWGAGTSAWIVLVGFSALGVLLVPVLHVTVRAEDRATDAGPAAESATHPAADPSLPVTGADR